MSASAGLYERITVKARKKGATLVKCERCPANRVQLEWDEPRKTWVCPMCGNGIDGRPIDAPVTTLRDTVLAALRTDQGMAPAEIHQRMNAYSLVSVRHELRRLCESGDAIGYGPNGSKLYRKVA